SVPFFCKAVGSSLTYQWRRNGVDIAGGTQDHYCVTNAQPTDGGLYTVIVSNQLGTVVSRAASLSVIYAVTTQAPTLPTQRDWVISTLTDLVITNTASDVADPNLVLSYQLINPPPGATINLAGIIQWTPGVLQGPSTNIFTTVVTDNGFPALSATNSFLVIVGQVNHPPLLPPQTDRTISSLTQFVVTNTATDPDLPAERLVYELINPPVGMVIDNQGIIRWTPTGVQVPCTNIIITAVTDDGTPNMSATNNFTLVVMDPRNVLYLPQQPDKTLQWPAELIVANTATSLLVPTNGMAYHLISAPPGATIDNQGIIRWVPSGAQVPSTNLITTEATDEGTPPLSVTNSFTVVVLALPNRGSVDVLGGPIINPANHHPYYLLQPSSWSDAEATAVSMGGHLVTINDQDEHFWVKSTFSSYGGVDRALWIGLIDPEPWLPNDGSWTWIEHFIWAGGEPITFFCWSTQGQPSYGVGRIKMCKPDPSWSWDQAEWAEEADATLLNGFVELPIYETLPLAITMQPQSISVGIGGDATLTMVAESTAPI